MKLKNTIFSKNEINFLNGLGKVEYEKNYIYQLRYTIKQKVKNFIFNDLEMLLEIKELNNIEPKSNISKILKDDWLDVLVTKILKRHPYLILKILRLTEVQEFLETTFRTNS